MIRRPPRSTPFPTRRSSDLPCRCRGGSRRRSASPAGRARRSLPARLARPSRSEEHTSELQSLTNLVCRLLLEKKKHKKKKLERVKIPQTSHSATSEQTTHDS